MPLMFLLVAPALAARVYWTSEPTEADAAAVARTLGEVSGAPLDRLMGAPEMGAEGDAALSVLRAEYEAAGPLLDVFDGELQIMGRLEKAISDVRVVRTVAERDLVWKAMLLEGYAVDRYFQDKLATESAAAPYRTSLGTAYVVSAWMDAAALLGAHVDPALPDAAARVKFDAVQAATRSMPSFTFVVGDIARGATVYIDGQKVEQGEGARVLAVPGRHFAHVEVDGIVLAAQSGRFNAGTTVTLSAPFGPAERSELATLAEHAAPGWSVPNAAVTVAKAAGEPVYVGVPGDGKPTLLRLDQGTATVTRVAPEARTGSSGVTARVAAGAGWATSGDWFLQNVDEGAPYTEGTVNAAAPSVAFGAGWQKGWLYLGAGVDLTVPLGEWHSLPTGQTALRPFVYPHVDAGIRYVQLTVGPQFPWYLGVGLQAEAPLVGPVELYGRAVWGSGLTQDRDGGAPSFDPLDTWNAWLGAAVRFGG